MTFDDGILKICETENMAEPGKKPVVGLKEKSRHYFGYGELGIRRIYEAAQAGQQITAVVNVPDWHDIRADDICILEDGTQFRIATVQPTKDENSLRITKLSLERIGEAYALKTEKD